MELLKNAISKSNSIYEGDKSLRKIEDYFDFKIAKTLVFFLKFIWKIYIV